ncbi:MAG: hypothetical protein ABI690_35530, partial [Chloroflexota bacterium]
YQIGYASNGYMHIVDLETGRDVNIGNPGSDANRTSASPDGQWIALWSLQEGSIWQLGLLNTSTWQQAGRGEFKIGFPTLSWSPDSRQLAFAAIPEGETLALPNHELFVMNIETGETRQLTNNTVLDYAPAFSPDGKRLVFTSTADGFNRLYILDIATDESHLLTDQTFGYLPSWSPDGKQLVFASNHEYRNNQIYVINADGTNLRRLTDNNATNEFPFWLP